MMSISFALAREIFYIELWHYIALVLTLSLNTLLYRYAENSPLLKKYLMLQGALLLWIVSKILKTVSPTELIRWHAIVSQFLGVSFLGVLFLEFAWTFQFDAQLPRTVRVPLYSISAVYFIFVWTNPFHHLIYSYYDFYRDKHGPLFFLFSVFTYAQIGVAIILCFRGLGKHRRGIIGILIGIAACIPLVVNILYIFRFIRPLFDITPIVMTASLFFFGIAALKFNFLSPLPVARSTLLETLGDPVIVTDEKNRVLIRHHCLESAMPENEFREGNKIFRLYTEKKVGRRIIRQYADVTSVISLTTDIAEQNKLFEKSVIELEKKNRSRLAIIEHGSIQRSRRALHDILGHSLTLVLYQLRAARKKNIDGIHKIALLSECQNLLFEGQKNLDENLKEKAQTETVLSLSLQKLEQTLIATDADLELVIGGKERPLTPSHIQILYDAAREGITNALRHGHASHIMLSVLFGSTGVLLSLADNGQGSSDWKQGAGLSMIASSVEAASGSLHVASASSEGFQITIHLPYTK